MIKKTQTYLIKETEKHYKNKQSHKITYEISIVKVNETFRGSYVRTSIRISSVLAMDLICECMNSNYSKYKVNREKVTEEKIERKLEKPVTQRNCIKKKILQ